MSSHAGIATHFIPSTRIDDVIESLSKATYGLESLPAYLEQFSGDLQDFSLRSHMNAIDRIFSSWSVRDIYKLLNVSKDQSFCAETLKTMNAMSPTAMFATLALLRRGRSMSLKDCLEMEYTLAKNFMIKVPDLPEGINAKLIRKEKSTTWNPSTVDAIEDSFIESLFQREKDDIDTLDFANQQDYRQYPHRDNALPTVQRIKEYVVENRNMKSTDELVEQICRVNHHKMGLREKLISVIQQHVKTREEIEKEGRMAVTNLTWID